MYFESCCCIILIIGLGENYVQSIKLCYTIRNVDHSDEGYLWLVRRYWTDLDIVLSLHVPEKCPYVPQCLFGVFALQPKFQGHVTKGIAK